MKKTKAGAIVRPVVEVDWELTGHKDNANNKLWKCKKCQHAGVRGYHR